MDRRAALALIGASVAGAGAGAGWPRPARAAAAARPWLATPEQVAAERMLRTLLRDPAIARIQAEARAELAASPRATSLPDGARTLDGAIAQWTKSLIFAEMIKDTARPRFLWATDDTPRSWLGYTIGGVGTSGDNPDAIYRVAAVEGGGRYEILGRYHAESRPTQLLIEVDRGDMAQASVIMPTAKSEKPGGGTQHQDIHSSAMINDRQLAVAADGTFRITLGPQPAGPGDSVNHLVIPAEGYCTVGVRDILADWTLRAAGLSIRRLDPVDAPPFGIEDVRKLVHRDLAGYIRFWANFPNIWFGGLKPNTHSPPQARPGGWGFVAGVNYHLAPDEALLVTTDPGGAKYTGFQINDPWMIAPDARLAQVCLNKSQVTPNADGTVTHIVAATDPGAANWIDTTGYRDGLAIVRWQQIPDGMSNEGLFRDFRVVKLSEVAAMRDLPRVTPAERRRRVAARKQAYETRVR